MRCRKSLRLHLLLALTLLAVAATSAAADTLLSIQGHTDGVRIGNRAQEARDSKVAVWLGADRMRRDEGTLSVIVRRDQKKIYIVNHSDRTYTMVDLPVDWMKLVPPRDQDSFKRFLADNAMQAAVTPSTESKKIRGWDAHRVDLAVSNAHGLKIATQMWVTKALASYDAYNQMSADVLSLQPNNVDWSKKLSQLGGFPVFQDTTVTVGGTSFKSREELLASETKDAPAGTYDVPAGFTSKPFDPYAQAN
jgi:hypothetical protein